MAVNSYLLVQAAVATAVSAPPGLSLGEWLAIITCFLVISGVVYRSGQASAKADHVESMVGAKLDAFSEKLDRIGAFVDDAQDRRTEWVRWRENITGRVSVLEGDAPVHLHQRETDR